MKNNKSIIFSLVKAISVFLVLLLLFPYKVQYILSVIFEFIEFTGYILLLPSSNIISFILFLIILFFFTSYTNKISTTICSIIVLFISISNFIFQFIDKIDFYTCNFELLIMNLYLLAVIIIVVSAYRKADNYLKLENQKEKSR